jgi:hypothetical protein
MAEQIKGQPNFDINAKIATTGVATGYRKLCS